MRPYAELLEFNQPNPIRKPGFTRIRDAFPGLSHLMGLFSDEHPPHMAGEYHDPERIMEFSGRWDYGENNARKLGETVRVPRKSEISDWTMDKAPFPKPDIQVDEVPIIQKYLGMGHESMIEMGDATFFIECSRVVSHELVRHRIASFQQESQRFVKYDGVTDQELGEMFFLPDVEYPADEEGIIPHYQKCLELYRELRKFGVAPQDARYVLPNGFRTRLIMKTNIREWRHILKLRLDKSAQPEMRELMQQIYDQLVDVFPNALHGVNDGGRGVR